MAIGFREFNIQQFRVEIAQPAIVIGQGGRIYLAKDAFTRPEHFRQMEPRLERFLEIRRKWDPQLKLKSAQSIRLFGDPP